MTYIDSEPIGIGAYLTSNPEEHTKLWTQLIEDRGRAPMSMVSRVESAMEGDFRNAVPELNRLREEYPLFQFEINAFGKLKSWIDLHGHTGNLFEELARYRAIVKSNDDPKTFDPEREQQEILKELDFADPSEVDSSTIVEGVLNGKVSIPFGTIEDK